MSVRVVVRVLLAGYVEVAALLSEMRVHF